MSERESTTTRRLDRAMRLVNTLVFPIVGGEMQPAGWPDRFYSHSLWSGFLEMKKGDGRLSTIQRNILLNLRKRGVPAFVCRFTEKLRIEEHTGKLLFEMDFSFTPQDCLRLLKCLDEHS